MSKITAVLFSLLSLSCSNLHESADNNRFNRRPLSVPDSSYHLPAFEEKKLENGLTIIYIDDQTLPYISYSMMVKGGASTDPEDLPGLSSFVGGLLEQGSDQQSAPQIADSLAQLGANFDELVGADYSQFNVGSLSGDALPLLKLYHEILTQPAFSESEVDRLRKIYISDLKRSADNPEVFVETAWDRFLYPEAHPYSHSPLGTEKGLAAIKRKNIIQQYKKYFRPNNSYLSVVGKLTPEIKTAVETTFGSWEKRDVPTVSFPALTNATHTSLRLVNKSDLVQAQIRLGEFGIKRNDPDFLSLRVANTILGGAFSSRLVDHVRRDMGLTYSIYSEFDPKQDVGPFEIGTFSKNETVGKTIHETMSVLTTFHDKGVTAQEVEEAKGYLSGIFPTSIETAEKLAFNLMVLRLYSIPDSYLSDYLSNLDKISVSDVNQAISKHIDPKNIKILVYGNARAISSQLTEWGPLQ
jgi:zinc protease